jgi:hypothetical protein
VTRRAHLGVFLLCLGLVAVYTRPLAWHPAHLVPDNTDPRLFSWVMISVFRNLLTRPTLLLHGSGFYPFGSSLTFAEPLVTPALLAGPLHALTGNPYLAYNLTLLVFWAASGWTMYAVGYGITRRPGAAAVGMLIFLLSPPRLEYAVEFQMEMMFALPVCVYALVRFLEAQRPRDLLVLLLAFGLQAVAVWYFAVILGCGLVVLALAFTLRRWTGWRLRAVAAAGGGGVLLLAALLPVAWPFVVTSRELGLERGLDEAVGRSAGLLTYLTTRDTWLGRIVPVSDVAETTLFPGVVAIGLAGLAVAWCRRSPGEPAGAPRWPERLAGAGAVASLAIAVLTVAGAGRLRWGSAWTRLPPVTACGVALLACLLARAAVAGWRRWRAGVGARRLSPGEWVSVLAPVGLTALLLSFGPTVLIGPLDAGPGLYAWLHPYLLPLRAIRGTTRFGLLVLLVVALLATLGTAWLLQRLPRRAATAAALVLPAAVLADYARPALPYDWIASFERPVDAVLQGDPSDVAVLEWPLNVPGVDVDATLRSVGHGKRVVNGFAGFVFDFHRELSGLLSEAGPPFPTPAARVALASIYPLRYLVVRQEDLPARARAEWAALRSQPPGLLRFRGTYGTDDLFEVVPLPEVGTRIDRLVAYDLLVTRPGLRATIAPTRTAPGVEQWVTVSLNGGTVGRFPLPRPTLSASLAGRRLFRAAPNVIRLEFGYRRTAASLGPAHRIGTTGAMSPLDARVRSAGQPYGDVASIRIGLRDVALNRRGYNLAAVDPHGPERIEPAAFDTFLDPAASRRLAAWIAALPAGTIVLGAVRDEASSRLDAGAIGALRTLGVAGDLRGRYRESHAFIGVKGAPPGSAVEASGPRAVEVTVGEPDAGFGLELRGFALEPLGRPGGSP